MGLPKTYTFNGKKYRIDVEPYHSACEQPKRPKRYIPEICFPDGIDNTLATLYKLIHEALHAENWEMSEEKVTRVSREVARFLWRFGYRRKKNAIAT